MHVLIFIRPWASHNTDPIPEMPMLALLFLLAFLGNVSPLNNGLGLTPQMGWSSWNGFRCTITEDIVNQTARALVCPRTIACSHLL